MSTPAENPSALAELIDALLEKWSSRPAQARPKYNLEPRTLLGVLGLCAHVHNLTSASMILYRAGHPREAFPVARSALEHALTAQWLQQYRADGLDSLLNESGRLNENLLRGLEELGWANTEAAQGLRALATHEPASADGAMRNFHEMCSDLGDHGKVAYSTYRLLSKPAHAGPETITSYVDFASSTVSVRPGVSQGQELLLLWSIATACTWAGRLLDLNERGGTNKQFYRTAARQLDVPDLLQLSDKAWLRREQWKHAHRKAAKRK